MTVKLNRNDAHALRMLVHALDASKSEALSANGVMLSCGERGATGTRLRKFERAMKHLESLGLVSVFQPKARKGIRPRPMFCASSAAQDFAEKVNPGRCLIVQPPTWTTSRHSKLPEWARDIAQAEIKKAFCTLIWNERSKATTSGVASWGKILTQQGEHHRILGPVITCTVGTDQPMEAQKALLLHEIAHHNAGLHNDHNAIWQKEAVRLYRKYGLLEWIATSGWPVYACEKKAVATALQRCQAAKRDGGK